MYYTQKIIIEGINAAKELLKHLQIPGPDQWDVAKYIAGFLKKEQGQIQITYRTPRELQFVTMVNANFPTNVKDCKIISGAIYTLRGAIIGWSSKFQRATTISSTEVEYVAMSTANQELLFMQNLMGKLGVTVKPGLLFNNNQGAIALVMN